MSWTITWTPSGGSPLTLTNDPTYSPALGMVGLGGPAVEHNIAATVNRDGGAFVGSQAAPRQFVLPLVVSGTSRANFLANVRALTSSLAEGKSVAGELKFAEESVTRWVYARFVGGMEAGNWELPDADLFYLTFIAEDPFWHAADQSATVTPDVYSGGLFFPVPPLEVIDNDIYSTVTINNPGDEMAWPVWTITGPGTNLVLKNSTTDKTLQLDYTLAQNRIITIDTRPRFDYVDDGKSILLDDDTDLFENIDLTKSQLWGLQPGNNTVLISLSSTESGVTSVEYDFAPLHWSR